jgi:MFS family permease
MRLVGFDTLYVEPCWRIIKGELILRLRIARVHRGREQHTCRNAKQLLAFSNAFRSQQRNEPSVDTRLARWQQFVQKGMASILPLYLVQLLSGAWILPQMSFFPIYLEEELHFAPLMLSAVVAAGQASGLAAALYGGRLSDTLGSKRVLVIGLSGGALASLVFLNQAPLLVAMLWMLGGAAGSLQTLGGSSYLTRAADPKRLGVLAALYALSMTLGGAFGSPAAGQVLDLSGFRLYGLIGVAVVAGAAIMAIGLLPAQQPGDTNEVQHKVKTLTLVRRPIVQILMGLRFMPTVYYGMVGVLAPLMINELAGNKTTVALYSTTSLIVASAAQLLAGRAADRYGHRWPVLIGYALLIVAALGMAIFARSLWGVFFFGVLGIAVAWALAALLFVLVSDGIPQTEHGRAFGLLHATWSIAMMCGALLGGALSQMSPGLPFLAAGLLNGLSIALALAFFSQIAQGRGAVEAAA